MSICPRFLARWKRTAVLLLPLFCVSTLPAQKAPFPALRVEKKAGAQIGSAVVTINGRNKILAHHAIQAWPIMENENALVLVAARNKSGGNEYHVRFYEGLTRKYRDLGTMPFAATEMTQAKQSDAVGSLF